MVKRRRLSDSSPSSTKSILIREDHNDNIDRELRARHVKRRYFGKSHLLDLPQELIIRILSFLPPKTLLTVSLTSHKLQSLASDPQVWKSKFWQRFVRPRLNRRTKLHGGFEHYDDDDNANSTVFSKEWRMWLDDRVLLQQERHLATMKTTSNLGTQDDNNSNGPDGTPAALTSTSSATPALDWKAKFRLRANWLRGVSIPAQMKLNPPNHQNLGSVTTSKGSNPAVGRFYEGYYFGADEVNGVRIWNCSRHGINARKLVCQQPLSIGAPSCLTIAEPLLNDTSGRLWIDYGIDFAIGFRNGSTAIYRYCPISNKLVIRYQKRVDGRRIDLVSFSFPYLITMTCANLLTIHAFDTTTSPHSQLPSPNIVSTMLSEKSWIPTCMNVRRHPTSAILIAAVIFSVWNITTGSSISVQEIHLNPQHPHKVLTSHVAHPPLQSAYDHIFFSRTTSFAFSVPTCVSYRYPFIMTSHADNTLTLYTATESTSSSSNTTSSENKLELSGGYKLWGHNAAVMAVDVGRTKAVSVDRRGEVRIWDLQARLERLTGRDKSVRVVGSGDPYISTTAASSSSSNTGLVQRPQVERCLVGFGEEGIVVLNKCKEAEDLHEDYRLMMYDFT